MFVVLVTSAPQLLNSVIEEQMSRISEVLLGSLTPFELMMGKLLGNAEIAMLLAALYVGGGFAVAAYHG
jgi:ABC-2 type transport system permease protein